MGNGVLSRREDRKRDTKSEIFREKEAGGYVSAYVVGMKQKES